MRDLSVFTGYEHEPSIVLGTTVKKVQSTTQWNPMVFALVLGKNELYAAIVKHVQGFNVWKMLNFDVDSDEMD